MPNIWPAATSCCVTAISALLGLASPDGWLCATTTLAARSLRGAANTSLGCINDEVSVPIATTRRAIRRHPLSSDRQRTYSCFLVRMNFKCGSMSSVVISGELLYIKHDPAAFRHPSRHEIQPLSGNFASHAQSSASRRYAYAIARFHKCNISA